MLIQSVSFCVLVLNIGLLLFLYFFVPFDKFGDLQFTKSYLTQFVLRKKNNDQAQDGSSSSSLNSTVSIKTIQGHLEELHSHCWKGYMNYAFPADDLRPISCSPRIHDPSADEKTFGNFSGTLIDSLDSLIIYGKHSEFIDAINYISSDEISFTSDFVVSTFETNIRVLGGLLSGHIYSTFLSQQLSQYRKYRERLETNWTLAGDPCNPIGCMFSYRPELYESFDRLSATNLDFQYQGQLLSKATQLGRRLHEAFQSGKSPIPYSRVNLKHGVFPHHVSDFTTTADAGTYLVEFGVLSLLTGDESFYRTARNTSLHMWNKRSKIDLVGRMWSVTRGEVANWTSGIHGGLDSFFEYLYKAGKLFNDHELSEAFRIASIALRNHCQREGVYSVCNMNDGAMHSPNRMHALGAFWPGLLLISGSIDDALESYSAFLNVFQKFSLLPEEFDVKSGHPLQSAYILRPEMYESTFYISQMFHYKSNDLANRVVIPAYNKLNNTLRTKCGVASQRDVMDPNSLWDVMESFFISETLVYLYLTVADRDVIDQRLPAPLEHMVFSTEAHLFALPEVHPELYVGLSGQPGVDEVRRRLCRMTKSSSTHCK